MRMIPSVAVAALSLFASLSASAQDAAPRVREICKADIASLCASAGDGEKGGGGAMRCLIQNQAKVSEPCGKAITEIQARRNAARQACKADAAKLCAEEAGKGGEGMQCLRAKASEVTKPCADALAALPAARGQGNAQAKGKTEGPVKAN